MVASAGDVNGDGIGDLIIGAREADPNGSSSGASYVVFGRDTATVGDFLANLNLSSLDGTNGFRIKGVAAGDQSGVSVASAGDVNGDGIGDLIIGAYQADPNAVFAAGASYVLFGSNAGFGADLNLSGLDGTNGFRISGEAANDASGFSVASAGDVNGDGIDDLLIGAKFADPNGSASGASYVVFGRDTATAGDFLANLNLSTLDGSNGFQINGELTLDQSGFSVASAGDFNGDGIDDLIIGARYADPNGVSSGASYVVFGSNVAFAANLDLSTLDGSNGFQINGALAGDQAGFSVASAGDLNGDGIDDLIIAAPYADPNGVSSGTTYVVFGSNAGVAATLELSGLDGSSGFRINGVAPDDISGFSVASAGDVNDDGFDDIVIGARAADPNGSMSGSSYVVFGSDAGFAAVLNLADLDGANGFRIDGAAADHRSGFSVAAAGDVNGDGIDDLIVGAPFATLNAINTSGGSYVIFGQAAVQAVVETGTGGDDNYVGGALDDDLSGGAGNDILNGGLGADLLTGGLGDDTYFVDDYSDTLVEASGEGSDIVKASVDWTLAVNFERLVLDGSADLDGTGNGAANQLTGNGGANTLDGAGGNDVLNGGLGADTLIGGLGNDTLVGGGGGDTFLIRAESVFTSSNPGGRTIETDSISDYALGQDEIDLSAIDAIAATGGVNDAFSIVAAFDGNAGQLTLTFGGGITTVLLDVDGDTVADYRLRINGDVRADTADWVL